MTDRTCTVDGCERRRHSKSMCAMHYQRWKRLGTTDPPVRPPASPCAFPGCDGPHYARGWCPLHYSRWRAGSPLAGRPGAPSVCTVEGCQKRSVSRGWCSTHYMRWKTNGALRLPWIDDVPPGTKWCRKCETYRPIAEFRLTRGRPSSPCKACSAVTNHRRRARQRLRATERYAALEIAERDSWVCQICGRRIGRSYSWPHPRSLSIDHIVPQSEGGDDVKANVQAAHLGCNIRKGTRGVDQLRLIG